MAMIGHSYIPALHGFETTMELMGHVPVVCACMGSVAGLGAVRTTISHFSLMVKESSQLFVAGPPVVERGFGKPVGKNELGGSSIHTIESGAVDKEVETEHEAFTAIREFLSYLPQNVWETPPRAAPTTRRGAVRNPCSAQSPGTGGKCIRCGISSRPSSTAIPGLRSIRAMAVHWRWAWRGCTAGRWESWQ